MLMVPQCHPRSLLRPRTVFVQSGRFTCALVVAIDHILLKIANGKLLFLRCSSCCREKDEEYYR